MAQHIALVIIFLCSVYVADNETTLSTDNSTVFVTDIPNNGSTDNSTVFVTDIPNNGSTDNSTVFVTDILMRPSNNGRSLICCINFLGYYLKNMDMYC